MFSGTDLFFVLFAGIFLGWFVGFIFHESIARRKANSHKYLKEDTSDKIIIANNMLLKISLWKMIVGFAPKDETGCYCTDGGEFLSDAFCRLGIESNTIDEQMALWKIERLDKKLGEI